MISYVRYTSTSKSSQGHRRPSTDAATALLKFTFLWMRKLNTAVNIKRNDEKVLRNSDEITGWNKKNCHINRSFQKKKKNQYKTILLSRSLHTSIFNLSSNGDSTIWACENMHYQAYQLLSTLHNKFMNSIRDSNISLRAWNKKRNIWK